MTADRTGGGYGRVSADLEAADTAIVALRDGGFVALAEDRGPDAIASLMIGAEFVTPATVTYLTTQAYGLVRLCLTDERCRRLGLQPVAGGGDDWQPTVSVAARDSGPTRATAEDRALTIATLVDPAASADDLVTPGHVFPLRARTGGVLERRGRTEAAIDLLRLAGCVPAAAMSLVVTPDGEPAVGTALEERCRELGAPLVTVAEVETAVRARGPLVELASSAALPTPYGDFRALAFKEIGSEAQHVALTTGRLDAAQEVLVGVHAECLTGDVLRATTCACRSELDDTLVRIAQAGAGVLVYLIGNAEGARRPLAAEGCGARALTVDDYAVGAKILEVLGLRSVRVLARDVAGASAMRAFGVDVVELLSHEANV